ncbi:DUF1444 family protein [Sporolactobacillus vineae]|uniref:DUF1444 family protein n=1 Tax=Sporolactobacillus vineae TaxID=444463 RepID=UPI000289C5EB|nr:DUF1444 family protein [Sporolactobacillus vineae]
MDLHKLRQKITDELNTDGRTIHFDSRSGKLRIEDKQTGKGFSVSLPDLLRQFEQTGENAVDECIRTIRKGLAALHTTLHLRGHENRIFPVVRSASFPQKTKSGKRLISRPHTAETRIFYVLDLGEAYRMIDESWAEEEGMDSSQVTRDAAANLTALPASPKKDMVRHNVFYFINENDGYDASRILNRQLLNMMKAKAHGDLAVAVPHQDVLIFADLVNPEGYDILAQMVMKFYAEGRVPVSLLPFIYDQGQLEPIFIMANRRPQPGQRKDNR